MKDTIIFIWLIFLTFVILSFVSFQQRLNSNSVEIDGRIIKTVNGLVEINEKVLDYLEQDASSKGIK